MSQNRRDRLLDSFSKSIRKTIDNFPGLRTMPEVDYCEFVLEAMDDIAEGLKMRQQELEEESGE